MCTSLNIPANRSYRLSSCQAESISKWVSKGPTLPRSLQNRHASTAYVEAYQAPMMLPVRVVTSAIC